MGPTNQLTFKPKWQLFLPLVWFRGELFEMRSPFTCVCSAITVQSCPIHSLLLRCCCGVEVKFRYWMGCTNADHVHVGRLIYSVTVYLFSGISAFMVVLWIHLEIKWRLNAPHHTWSFYRKQYVYLWNNDRYKTEIHKNTLSGSNFILNSCKVNIKK